MIDEICVKAFAKVNFGLNVLPKRDDGFHCIESIFQTVDLFDTLRLSFIEEKTCIVECPSMKLPEKNYWTNMPRAEERMSEKS